MTLDYFGLNDTDNYDIYHEEENKDDERTNVDNDIISNDEILTYLDTETTLASSNKGISYSLFKVICNDLFNNIKNNKE